MYLLCSFNTVTRLLKTFTKSCASFLSIFLKLYVFISVTKLIHYFQISKYYKLIFDKNEKISTLYDAIDGDKDIVEVIKPTGVKGLDIIPATVDLAGAEVELVSMRNRERVVKDLLRKIKVNYDYIFIDCPPSLGLLTINALTTSDPVVIPIQCEFFALEGLTQLMNTIKLVKKHLNENIDVEGVILTMKTSRSNLIQDVSQEIKRFFGKKVYETFIPRSIRLAEAPSHGQSIMQYDPKSKGGVAYYELAKEFLDRNRDSYKNITKF